MRKTASTAAPEVKVKKDGREVTNEAAWQLRRRAAYDIDLGVCQMCLHEVRFEDCDIDHIKGRGLGGGTRDDRLENLQTLCRRCHRMVKHK